VRNCIISKYFCFNLINRTFLIEFIFNPFYVFQNTKDFFFLQNVFFWIHFRSEGEQSSVEEDGGGRV
jgi:hypothetical protein